MLCLMSLAVGTVFALIATATGRQVPGFVWGLLVVGITLPFILFQGWGRVFAAIGQGIGYVAPHVQAAGGAVGRQARSNVAATVAVIALLLSFIFLGLAIGYDSKGWAEAGVLTFVGSVVFWIIHFGGVQTFSNHWRGFWLMFSIFGGLYTVAFGYGWWTIGVFTASAVIAGLVVAFGEEATLKGFLATVWWVIRVAGRAISWAAGGFAKLLGGKWGKDTACFTASLIALAIGLAFSGAAVTVDIGGWTVGVAVVAMAAAVGLFIASAMLGAEKHLVIPTAKALGGK